MRPDLTRVCTRCRVRLPQPLESCPFCLKQLQFGSATQYQYVSRPWPVLPWKILGWLIGLLGLVALLITPPLTLWVIVLSIVEQEPTVVLVLGSTPISVMALATGLALLLAIVGGATAVVAVLLGGILRPARGFDVYPLTAPAPPVARSKLLGLLQRLEQQSKPKLAETRRQNATGILVLVYVLVFAPIGVITDGWDSLCITSFGAVVWAVGWMWWFAVLAEGPAWFVGLMDPTYAKERRAACPSRSEWMGMADDWCEGSIVAPFADLVAVPDGGEPAIGWHVRGRANEHVIDDARLTSFVMATSDGERIVVLASDEILVELSPEAQTDVALDGAFLGARGFGVLRPDRVALRRLHIGDRVTVAGVRGEVRDPEGGYRGGMLRALQAGEGPLRVRYSSSSASD